MALRLPKVREQFIDEDGNAVEGAFFTVRRRMSFDCQEEYQQSIARLIDDPDALSKLSEEERNKTLARVAREHVEEFKALSKLLIDDCLLSLEGVEKDDGDPWPLDDFHTFDSHYVAQVVQKVQALNTPKEEASPNSKKPSRRS